MRIIFALFLSFSISIGIFFGMHLMTNSSNSNIKKESKTRHLVYLREKKETSIERKKRVKPRKPPKKEPPKKIKIVKTTINAKINQNVKIKPFKAISKNIDISTISSLVGAQVEIGNVLVDARSLQVEKRVNPKFPRSAKIKKISGFVQLKFHIDKEGNVSKPIVIDSNPKGVFERNAIKAIMKWKFKSMKEEKDAIIKYNFRLAS